MQFNTNGIVAFDTEAYLYKLNLLPFFDFIPLVMTPHNAISASSAVRLL